MPSLREVNIHIFLFFVCFTLHERTNVLRKGLRIADLCAPSPHRKMRFSRHGISFNTVKIRKIFYQMFSDISILLNIFKPSLSDTTAKYFILKNLKVKLSNGVRVRFVEHVEHAQLSHKHPKNGVRCPSEWNHI